MENLNFLLGFSKKELINLIIEQATNECGMFNQEELRTRLNKERRFLLLYLIIKSELNKSFIAEEIRLQLNYLIN